MTCHCSDTVMYSLGLRDDTRLFEEVDGELRARDLSRPREGHVEVLAEATRVVVDARLCVAKSFHEWVHEKYLLLEIAIGRLAHGDQLLEEKVRRLRLARATFSRDDDTLALLLMQHRVIGSVCHGVDVRRVLRLGSVSVQLRVLIVQNDASVTSRVHEKCLMRIFTHHVAVKV